MSSSLFESEFDAVTNQEWMDKIVKDLKGASYEKLNWNLDANTIIHPFYTQERNKEFDTTIHQEIVSQLKANSWLIIQDLKGAPKDEIEKALASDVSIIQRSEKDELLNKSSISCEITSKESLQSIRSKYLDIKLYTDPIKNWIEGNTQYVDLDLLLENDLNLSISSSPFHNAGADDILELALLLSSLNEYLHHLRSHEKTPKEINIEVAIGINFYSGVAKLRSLRILLKKLLDAYQLNGVKINIIASTSSYYNSHCDQHTNLLRHTTMGLSAVLGACDGLKISPFDNGSSLSYRMARNIQHLLKEEAYIDKVQDMMAGSYFIEELTLTFIDKVWESFREMEDREGLLKGLKSGEIKEVLNQQHQQRVKGYNAEENTMIGVNKFGLADENVTKKTKVSEDDRPWVLPSITLSTTI